MAHEYDYGETDDDETIDTEPTDDTGDEDYGDDDEGSEDEDADGDDDESDSDDDDEGEDDGDEDDESDDGSEDDDPKGVKKRFAKMTARRRAAERKAADLQAEVDRLKALDGNGSTARETLSRYGILPEICSAADAKLLDTAERNRKLARSLRRQIDRLSGDETVELGGKEYTRDALRDWLEEVQDEDEQIGSRAKDLRAKLSKRTERILRLGLAAEKKLAEAKKHGKKAGKKPTKSQRRDVSAEEDLYAEERPRSKKPGRVPHKVNGRRLTPDERLRMLCSI